MVFFALFMFSLVVSAVQATWPILLGLSLSWASMRYLKKFSVYDEEGT
jgi:hypothetical protein